MCFELNVKNVTSFLSKKVNIWTNWHWFHTCGGTRTKHCQNTSKYLFESRPWFWQKCLAIITKFYFKEDISIPFTGKALWFAIYAIRTKLNKHWKRWRNFKWKKTFSQNPEDRQKSPQNSRNMKRLHKVTFNFVWPG